MLRTAYEQWRADAPKRRLVFEKWSCWRVIAMITKMIDEGKLSGLKRMFLHLIDAEDITRGLSASSKMNFDWKFLTHLFAMGRVRAEKWLTENFELLGVKTTFDLHSKYL